MSYAVYVVDDDESVARSLKWLIEPLGYEVHTYENGLAFLDSYKENGVNPVGVLVVDVRMPVMGGFELQRELNALEFSLPIIFLSGHGDVPLAVTAIKDGAHDFLQKPINDQVLIDKINGAIRRSLDQKISSEHLGEASGKIAGLSSREREILQCVSDGMSSKEIARKLDISHKTVEVHRANIRKKLGLKSIAELTKVFCDLR